MRATPNARRLDPPGRSSRRYPNVARVVLSGRLRPLPSWLVAPEWQGLFRDLPIGPLGEHDVVEALTRRGHGEQPARRVYSLTRGHPLAMGLALTAMAGRSDIGRLEQIVSQGLVQRLAEICLMDAADPLARKAAEAGSIVRRVTRSLLAAMLPDAEAETAYKQLEALSFVDDSVEGLIVHDAVREAISSALRCSNPTRHRQYRRDAWRQLRAEMRLAPPSDMWRYAADMLYLAEEPGVREAFFPSGAHELSVEQARAGDGESIRTIVERNESPSATKILLEWWERAPDGFRVLRGYDGKVTGCCLFLYPEANANWGSHDPLARACVRHLEQRSVPRSQQAIYLRRWLSLDRGERPSPVQGACWLEAKRSYVSLRSSLRRCYISVCDLAEYGPVAQRLGFRVVEPATTNIDGQAHHLAVLDFGPGAVESWLPQVAAREMGIAEQDILDTDARELVLDGERIGLTELEFGVMRHLCHRVDKPVSRADLLEDVWGHTQDCGSNVVDVVIRSLRKKLADRATAIETVRGVGYRFRA